MKLSKGLAVLLAAVMTMSLFPTGVGAAETVETELVSAEHEMSGTGECGENLVYRMDDEGTLTISGTGEMQNYILDNSDVSPWSGQSDINKVIIEEGVTSIGENAFNGCKGIAEISLPDSLTKIENYAFENCPALKSVEIPASVTTIGERAFGWYEESKGTLSAVDEFSVCGHTNTAAETYARDNGFEFISIGEVNPDESEESDISAEMESEAVLLHDSAASEETYSICFDAGDGFFYDDDGEKIKVLENQIMKGDALYWIMPDIHNDISLKKAFVGWSTDRAGKKLIDIWEYVPTKNTTIYAIWKDGWKITFDAGEGYFSSYEDDSEIKRKTYSDILIKGLGMDTLYPDEPLIDNSLHKVFVGWSTDRAGKNRIEDNYVPTKDTTIYAVWEDAWEITLDAGEGYFHGDESKKRITVYVQKGASLSSVSIDSPEIVESSGKKFFGWSQGPKGDTAIDVYEYQPTKDCVLYAIWKKAFDIKFHDTNHSWSTLTVLAGDRIDWEPSIDSDIADDMAETGKVFAGWASDEEGQTIVENIEDIIPESDMSFYSAWRDAWKITYDAGVGYFDEDEKECQYTGLVEKGKSLDKEYIFRDGENVGYGWFPEAKIDDSYGKIFAYWAEDKAGKKRIDDIDHFVPKKNMTLYAIWEDAWTIKFDSGKESASEMATIILKKGETLYDKCPRIYGNEFKNKVFVGWALDPSGNKMISEKTYIPKGDTTLYAIWKDAWVITFKSEEESFYDGESGKGGGYTSSLRQKVVKGEPIGIFGDYSTSTYYRYGAQRVLVKNPESKALAGWRTEKNGGNIIESLVGYVPASDMTFYAVWKDAWTVTFDPGEDAYVSGYSSEKTQVLKGSSIGEDVTAEKVGDESKAFAGWSTTKNGTNIINNIREYVPKKDITLYAVWKDAWTITFDSNGANLGSDFDAQVMEEKLAKGSALGKLSYYYFQNGSDNKVILWSTDPKGNGIIRDIENYVPKGNMTLYAIEKEAFVVTFDANGGYFVDSKNGNVLPRIYGWASLHTKTWNEEAHFVMKGGSVSSLPVVIHAETWEGTFPIDSSIRGAVPEAHSVKGVFKGWATDPEGKHMISDISNYKPNGNVTLYAIWGDDHISEQPTWTRLAGNGRYDTMSEIVKTGFTKTGGAVVVATGAGFKDALAAAGLAGLYDAPVILTDGKSLSSQAQQLMKRLKPSKVYIAGGEAAVNKNVFNSIKSLTGVEPKRCFGQNSAGTSAALATAGSGWSDTAIIATNRTFKDALSAAPVSYSLHMPILLADNGKSLNADVLNALKKCGIKKVIIVGGKLAVTENVENQLVKNSIAKKNISRIAGNTAVDTSAKIAEYGLSHGMTINGMGIATSQNYPDALAGAALCGYNNSVLLLADDKAMQNTSFPKKYKADFANGYVFGGTLAVSDKVVKALEAAVK